jgi:hypothetical protein
MSTLPVASSLASAPLIHLPQPPAPVKRGEIAGFLRATRPMHDPGYGPTISQNLQVLFRRRNSRKGAR